MTGEYRNLTTESHFELEEIKQAIEECHNSLAGDFAWKEFDAYLEDNFPELLASLKGTFCLLWPGILLCITVTVTVHTHVHARG